MFKTLEKLGNLSLLPRRRIRLWRRATSCKVFCTSRLAALARRIKSEQKKYAGVACMLLVVVALGVVAIFPQPAEALSGIGWFVAQLISWVVSLLVYIIGLLIGKVIEILIMLAAYNEFINAPAVTIGWLVLRDVANMIVVVLLLVIAVSTILSVEEYQYKHMLPRLLIMAVMVNFSKTIVGFLIDASQIVMLTFVAAFQEAGAGNFVAALNLEKMLSINPEYTGDAGALEVMGGLFLALILMIVALVVLVVMTVIIGFRIVMLWILTVFSPLVFILSSVEAGKEYYAKWWKQFTNYLIVGPVLAFFIWLTLAATGGTPGSDSRAVQTFARNGNVSYFANAQEQGFITAAGHWQNLIGFLIAISMLVGGLMITEELGVVGSGFARSALEGMKDYGKEILHHGAKGAMEIGEWATRKIKAGKAPGLKWMRGVELNPMALYHNIKEQLEEKKEKEENEGFINAIARLEKGGLSGMLLGMGSKSWVENYGEGFLMRKGIGKVTGAWLHGRTSDHVEKKQDAEKLAIAQDDRQAKAEKQVKTLTDLGQTQAQITAAKNSVSTYQALLQQAITSGDVDKIKAAQSTITAAKGKVSELEVKRVQLDAESIADGRTAAQARADSANAIMKAKAARVIRDEEKELAEKTAHYSPMDFEGRKMRRAEVNDRMKKYDTTNEEELIPLFKSAAERGDTFEAAAIAKKAFSVGHGNEIVQAIKLEKGDLAKYGKDDTGIDRTHPNGTKYEEGDYLSCDSDGLAIMVNKIFRDKLKMGVQEAYALQSDLSGEAEKLDSRWYNLAQSIGALPDGSLRQRTKEEQMLHMGIEQDKGDLETGNRRAGRGAYGGEMYRDPKDPTSGRLVFLDERALRNFADNFGTILERGIKGGRFNLSSAMNIMSNPANDKILTQLGEYLKSVGKFTQQGEKGVVNFDQFRQAMKDFAQSAKATSAKMQGAANVMGKTLRDISAVRKRALP